MTLKMNPEDKNKANKLEGSGNDSILTLEKQMLVSFGHVELIGFLDRSDRSLLIHQDVDVKECELPVVVADFFLPDGNACC